MDLARFARHLVRFPRALPGDAMNAIEQAVADSESTHRAEIRVAVEDALHPKALLAGQSGRERALEVFSLLRVWDTEENNGVLIYLLLADHDIEIVADRGLNGKVSAAEWEAICRTMEAGLRQGELAKAVVAGIESVSKLLVRHYPPLPGDRDELPNKPVRLR